MLTYPCECPLIGVNRKWLSEGQSDANDPKQKFVSLSFNLDLGYTCRRSKLRLTNKKTGADVLGAGFKLFSGNHALTISK